ncbi:hypothetical protein ACIG87_22240 [Micromonospora sp. NPDC051925]|uniref:hypothetical protein n=1 Tax=Micromonospora sp. NPDC051925 TaxID=3364288 RepID=UPI0037CB9933
MTRTPWRSFAGQFGVAVLEGQPGRAAGSAGLPALPSQPTSAVRRQGRRCGRDGPRGMPAPTG